MWISEKLQRENENGCTAEGTVVTGGEKPTVSGERELMAPLVVTPYGLYSLIPQGQRAVSADDKVIGVAARPPAALEEGEVCLYSKGGSLVLKNNGDVLINGRKLTF